MVNFSTTSIVEHPESATIQWCFNTIHRKMSPAKKLIRKRRHDDNMEDPEYLEKRSKNNLAVQKSREKAKAKVHQTHERVTALKEENHALEGKIKLLSKELAFLKDIFIAHAGQLEHLIPQFNRIMNNPEYLRVLNKLPVELNTKA